MEPDKKRPKLMYENFTINPNKNQSVLIIGGRETGKTTLIKKFIGTKQKDYILDIYNEQLKEYDTNKYNVYNSIDKLGRDFFDNIGNNNNKNIVIENYPNIFNYDNNYIKEFSFNIRHYKSSFIVSQQYPENIKPEYRLNFDYIFIGRNENTHNLKNIYKWYAGMFSSFNDFINAYQCITKNNRFMVIYQHYSNDMNKMIFVYN
jgi:AAA+ ATPase superfamily predicted ATPase